MSPRAAGWSAITGSLILAALGGYLLATPPWSIPGAIIVVAATILLSVGTVWLYRRSWSDPWPPDDAAIFLLMGLSNLSVSRLTLRRLREQQASEQS